MLVTRTRLFVATLAAIAIGLQLEACGSDVEPDSAQSAASESSSSSSATGSASGSGGATGGGGSGAEAGGGAGGVGDGGGGAGGEGGCTTTVDCPPPTTECVAAVCTASMCTTENLPALTPLVAQTPADCKLAVCDGMGAVTSTNDDTDIETDGTACTVDACSSGQPQHPPAAAGTACAEGGGKLCDGAGACVECLTGADCTTGVCQAGVCQPGSCGDGVQNGNETDIDCGGSCGPCPVGMGCSVGADCQSLVCTTGICQPPTCADNVENGGETDIDCGGGTCTPCGPGEGCLVGADCVGGSCLAQICAPTCTDMVKNAAESDVDCGGPICADCVDGKACGTNGDCVSNYCHPSTGLCSTPNCSDGAKNGTETDVDCGGPSCPDCANGKLCAVSGDCQSGLCYEGVCVGSVNGCTLAGSTDFGAGPVTVTFPNVNFTYSPKCIKVNAGAQVTFNGSFLGHPLQGGVVNGAVATPASSGPFVPVTNMGVSKTFSMSTPGAFPYYCTVHYAFGMTGAVFVVP